MDDIFILEKLSSHIAQHIQDKTDELSNIRTFFADRGCDILNYQDSEGKTLLHYSIMGMYKYFMVYLAYVTLNYSVFYLL